MRVLWLQLVNTQKVGLGKLKIYKPTNTLCEYFVLWQILKQDQNHSWEFTAPLERKCPAPNKISRDKSGFMLQAERCTERRHSFDQGESQLFQRQAEVCPKIQINPELTLVSDSLLFYQKWLNNLRLWLEESMLCKGNRTFYMPSLDCLDNLKYKTGKPNQTKKTSHLVTEYYHIWASVWKIHTLTKGINWKHKTLLQQVPFNL